LSYALRLKARLVLAMLFKTFSAAVFGIDARGDVEIESSACVRERTLRARKIQPGLRLGSTRFFAIL
jgi:hypothetical protein